MKQFLLSFILLGVVAAPVRAQEREMILPVPQSAYSQAVKIKGGTLVVSIRCWACRREGRTRCAG